MTNPIEVDDELLGYGDILAVNATLIEFLIFFGYYKPANSNEPNQLLNDMTKFTVDCINGKPPPWAASAQEKAN